ncbi:Tryptophan-specific permease, 5-methyltryptophan resistance [Corynebacterium pseudotuberculosis]|nr:Tryptophan-specific permease, 5-methyltryptophan resistance [Corynebacterium pseudotuberculosis]
MIGMTVVGTLLAIIAIALIIIGAWAWTRRLPGNSYVGIRVPEVRKTQELWTTAHQVAGPLWVVGGIAVGIAATLCFAPSGWLHLMSIIAVLAGILFVSIGANVGARAASLLDAQADAIAASESTCCSAGGSADVEEETQTSTSFTPDLEALRRAAQASDN